jgi:hypothetical protein
MQGLTNVNTEKNDKKWLTGIILLCRVQIMKGFYYGHKQKTKASDCR